MSTDDARRLAGISVVVPTYRSPDTLATVCAEVQTHITPLCDELELIFVDDGNIDDTWAVITDLANGFAWVRGVQLLRNYGQHNALLAGLREARLPVVLTIDDDLQNPPTEVPLLVAALDENVDLVYGTPTSAPHGRLRSFASRSVKFFMAKLLGPDVFPRSSAFRLFRRELVDAANEVHDPLASIDVVLSWATTRVRAVPVAFAERTAGTSGYNFRKLVRHAVNMISGYSTRPLRWVSVVGSIFALLGFALLTFVIIRYLVGETTVAGFTFLAATVSMFSGVQLLSLGVVGEYLARVHYRSMGKPPFVIRKRTGVN